MGLSRPLSQRGWSLGLLKAREPYVKETIGLLGRAILIWIGAGMAKFSKRAELPGLKEGGNRNPLTPLPEGGALLRGAALAGALTSLSNPYWALWWLTIGAKYVALALGRGRWGWLLSTLAMPSGM
ncbi:MAG TPA: hypothetical protein EYP65_04335 [Armatimonadetes bacterium]|nr:hypothetical protein [Armatimonadota bacterium]